MRFAVDVAPRFDYGRQAHVTELLDARRGVPLRPMTLTLHVVRQPDDAHSRRPGSRTVTSG
jgi:hypothetical protein